MVQGAKGPQAEQVVPL
ncbi:hypothetical protein [Streptomyces sp. NPDC001292]